MLGFHEEFPARSKLFTGSINISAHCSTFASHLYLPAEAGSKKLDLL